MLRKVLNHPAPLIALASSNSRCIWNIAPFVVRVPYAMNSETCAITMSHIVPYVGTRMNRPMMSHASPITMPGTVCGMNASASRIDFPRTRLRTTNHETTADRSMVTAGTTMMSSSEFRKPWRNSCFPGPKRMNR